MKRLLAAIKNDATIQFRNKLYSIGILIGLILSVALWWLANPGNLKLAIPTAMLLVVGGTTLFYVGGMIIFEKQEGTLSFVSVSPLSTLEYLGSKIISLTVLSTLESVVMIAGVTLFMSFTLEITMPNILALLAGIVGISVMYILIGIILIVRCDKITDFLIPMAGIAILLEVPAIYFLDIVANPLFLLIPSTAPTLFIKGAYISLGWWEWVYAIAYTLIAIIVLSVWAIKAFQAHVIKGYG